MNGDVAAAVDWPCGRWWNCRTPAPPPLPPPVAHAPAKTRYPVVVGDDHPAFARGDLLVGIEREHHPVRERAVPGLRALVFRPQGLAGVLDHHEPVAVRGLADDIEPRRLAEGVHREDGLRARSDSILDRIRVDVCQYGLCSSRRSYWRKTGQPQTDPRSKMSLWGNSPVKEARRSAGADNTEWRSGCEVSTIK